MASERAEAIIVMPSPMLFGEYERIVSIAPDNKLPAIWAAREFVDLGGLMSYGAILPHLARPAATYAYKILKGAKPAELAVEQRTKFEFVVNLKTAKALGLSVPFSLLARADELIEYAQTVLRSQLVAPARFRKWHSFPVRYCAAISPGIRGALCRANDSLFMPQTDSWWPRRSASGMTSTLGIRQDR